jgi:hypothetical protein
MTRFLPDEDIVEDSLGIVISDTDFLVATRRGAFFAVAINNSTEDK